MNETIKPKYGPGRIALIVLSVGATGLVVLFLLLALVGSFLPDVEVDQAAPATSASPTKEEPTPEPSPSESPEKASPSPTKEPKPSPSATTTKAKPKPKPAETTKAKPKPEPKKTSKKPEPKPKKKKPEPTGVEAIEKRYLEFAGDPTERCEEEGPDSWTCFYEGVKDGPGDLQIVLTIPARFTQATIDTAVEHASNSFWFTIGCEFPDLGTIVVTANGLDNNSFRFDQPLGC